MYVIQRANLKIINTINHNRDLMYKHISSILGKDITCSTTHKQRASLANRFRNAKGIFHKYVHAVRKINKEFLCIKMKPI